MSVASISVSTGTGTLEWGKVGRVAVGICGVPLIDVYQRLVLYNI